MTSSWLGLRAVTVQLRNIPGAVLLMEPIRTRFLVVDRRETVPDFQGGLQIDVWLGGHMGSQIFWYGSYSRHILRIMNLLLTPGMTVIDVGANLGEITLTAAGLVGSSGRVLSFEPGEGSRGELLHNIAINRLGQVEVFSVALSDHEGTARLYTSPTPFRDGTTHEGLATLYPDEERHQEVQSVPLTRLDALADELNLKRLDLIKIDVEGAEVAVLDGARETLRRWTPWIIVEINRGTSASASVRPEDILAMLSDVGYRFYRIDRRRHLTELRPADLGAFENVLARPLGRKSSLFSD